MIEHPQDYQLIQNFPNPFNNETTIKYQLVAAGKVTIDIYNNTGQLVSRILNNYREPGYHSIKWKANSQTSGVYFVKMSVNNFTSTKKCIVLK